MNDYFTPAADVAPDTKVRSVDYNNLLASILAAFDKFPALVALFTNSMNYAVDAGTVNALAITVNPVITALTDGYEARVKVAFANTSTTPTLNVNGLGAVVITRNDGSALHVADIPAGICRFSYNATTSRWTYAPAGAAGTPGTPGAAGAPGTTYLTLRVRDEKASGTGAGTATGANATTTRTFNTTKTNTIPGASLAGNQVTLPAGTYEVDASAPALAASGHFAYLYCVTDSAVVVTGTSETAAASSSSNRSFVKGEFTIASAKVYELRHYTTTSGAFLGIATANGNVEVYSEAAFKKLA